MSYRHRDETWRRAYQTQSTRLELAYARKVFDEVVNEAVEKEGATAVFCTVCCSDVNRFGQMKSNVACKLNGLHGLTQPVSESELLHACQIDPVRPQLQRKLTSAMGLAVMSLTTG